MKQNDGANGVLLLAALSAGLLFDPMGFLRMALAASVMHEAGHILVYTLCTRSLPRLAPSLGGISLRMDKLLTRRQEAAGDMRRPACQFSGGCGMFLSAWHNASLRAVFFCRRSSMYGLYNCLPFGVLDGAH